MYYLLMLSLVSRAEENSTEVNNTKQTTKDKTDNKTGKTDNKANKTEKLDHKTVSVLTLFLNEEKQTELKSQQRHVLTLFLHSVIHERRRKLARVASLP